MLLDFCKAISKGMTMIASYERNKQMQIQRLSHTYSNMIGITTAQQTSDQEQTCCHDLSCESALQQNLKVFLCCLDASQFV